MNPPINPKIGLEQRRALVAVVDAGGYAQAASLLHKSQSAVTYAVQKLEGVLDVKAFEIQGRKAVLTPTGQLLYRRARALLDEAGGLEKAARSLSAGWEPESVEFIECHATGTPVGDAVEFSSLSQLWANRAWSPGQCTLGAVKANVGHLLTGAGAAGLLKVLLSLRHNTLPPVANFQKGSEKIPLAQSPFRVLTQSQPWPKRADGQPRRAAINGFGFGGQNASALFGKLRD